MKLQYFFDDLAVYFDDHIHLFTPFGYKNTAVPIGTTVLYMLEFCDIIYAFYNKGGDAMVRYPVSSSRISSVGWENNILEVQFKNGAVYRYFDVTEQEYRSFLGSSSLGKEISRIDKTHRYLRVG